MSRARGVARARAELEGRPVRRRLFRPVANPWLDCGGRPAPPACIARLEAQVARGALAPAEAVRRLHCAHNAALSRAVAHLAAAYACPGMTTWGALDLARAPHADAHALHEAILRMKHRHGVPDRATVTFRPGGA